MKKQHQLVWRREHDGRGVYKRIELSLPPGHKVLKVVDGPKSLHHTLNVDGDPPPDSEFLLLPTFISPGQRKLIWAFACSALCFGVFVGIVFILVVQGWSGSNGDADAPAEDEAPVILPSNASDNCTLTYDPDDISELMRETYVRNFFNLTCLATNGTGDPCDVHIAEEYTYRMFSALRFDRLVMEFLAVIAIFSLAQIGGIPRPTDWNGLFFWIAWMATMLAQSVVVLCALILQVFSFLGVRARLAQCLIQVDGTALLDFYAMCTFAVQPELIVKAVVLFVYAFLLSLGMLVFDGSREWPWLSKLEDKAAVEKKLVTLTLTPNPSCGSQDPNLVSATLTAEPGGNEADQSFGRLEKILKGAVRRIEKTLTVRFPRAARFLQSPPISKAEFMKDATGPTMPKDKRFKVKVPLALCCYHLARTIVLGASFSMWAALGSPAAAPGVVTACWVLAFFAAVLAAKAPWKRLDDMVVMLGRRLRGIRADHGADILKLSLYLPLLILFCPLLSASAIRILPLSALFILAVQLAYFLGGLLLAHIGPSAADGDAQAWVNVPDCKCCKWTDALAGPARTCLSWIKSTSIFSYVDCVLGRPQGEALAFTGTSYATLAGGLSCFWVLLALAPVASHIVWARSRSLTAGAFANATDAALAVEDELTGGWSWVWGSLMVWLWLGAAIVLCCCSLGNVIAGRLVYEEEMEARRFPKCWVKMFASSNMPLRVLWLVKTAVACSLGALTIFIFTASQTVDAKERIATTYANSFAMLSGLKLDLDGIFPSFDKLVEVLNDPAAALSSVGQRIANLSSYAELDPAHFSEGVQALTAINLVLSFVKLLATYGRKLFALMDAAKSILKAYAGYEAASEGDDGTVQVNETMTDLEAIAILDLLNKREIKRNYNGIEDLSFAKLLLEEELKFHDCLVDGDLPGLVTLVTHPEMVVKARSLNLERNELVTAEAWQRELPRMLTKGSLTSLNLENNRLCGINPSDGKGTYTAEGITKLCEGLKGSAVTSLNISRNFLGPEGGAALAEGLKGNSTLQSLDLGRDQLCGVTFWGIGTYTTEGITKLCEALKGSAVTSLSLHGNRIGAQGASAIAAVLKETQITDLNLAENQLCGLDLMGRGTYTAKGITKLCEALKGSAVTSLDLYDNGIGDKGASAIAAILKETMISNLNLENNNLDEQTKQAVTDAAGSDVKITF